MFDHSGAPTGSCRFGDLQRVVPASAVLSAARLWAARLDDDDAHHSARRSRRHSPVSSAQARFLDADPSSLTADEAVDALIAVQDQRARLDALEVGLLARAAGATRVVRDVLVEHLDPDTGLPSTDREPRTIPMVDEVLDEIASALHRPLATVMHQVAVARFLRGPLARTLATLADGQTTLAHATAIADQAARLAIGPLGHDPDADLVLALACDRLQDAVLPHAGTETVTECRSRARRAVVRIDPAGAAARRRRAKLTCDVVGHGLDDGLAVIEATLPALDAARILAVIDAATRTGDAAAFGDLDADATLGQLRAAAFTQLILAAREPAAPSADGSADGGARTRVEIGVLIDAATLTGLTPDEPVWVQAGAGQPVDADRDDLIDLLADPGVDATIRRLVTDPATGALIDRGANAYRVSGSLRAWLTARDRTCTHPGCTRPARRCDVDHAVDFADGGRTTVSNNRLMCRRHHNAKTHCGWSITDAKADGSCTFISPAGRTYYHRPVDLGTATPPEDPPAADLEVGVDFPAPNPPQPQDRQRE